MNTETEKMFTDEGEVVNPAATWVQNHHAMIECTQCQRRVQLTIFCGGETNRASLQCGTTEVLPRSPDHYKSNGALKRRKLPGGWSWNEYMHRFERFVVHHQSDVLETPAFFETEEGKRQLEFTKKWNSDGTPRI
jgi:hypothetical protein